MFVYKLIITSSEVILSHVKINEIILNNTLNIIKKSK